MTEAPDRAVAQQIDVPDTCNAESQAWYLYGIIRASRPRHEQQGSGQRKTRSALGSLTVEGVPLKLLEHGDLAAVVRRVSRHDFTDESMQARLRDPVALETTVRAHNQVIATIHGKQAILPAKFGGVYARLEDVQMALERAHDTLRAQLDRLEGCDEWAVHIYADPAIVQQRVPAEDAAIRQLREELGAARPGRAYFLQRKLADQLAAVTDQALSELARAAYDQLVRPAVAGQMSPPARPPAGHEGAIELLRAAFLVPSTAADLFIRGVDSLAADHEGVRCEYSGPWPPYSFAAEEEP